MSSSVVLYERKNLPSKLGLIGFAVLAVGIILTVLSFMNDSTRASFNMIITLTWVYSIGLGALFLMALEYIVGADWSVPFRRITEIVASILFVVPILSIPLLMNLDAVFTWLHPQLLQADKYVAGKSPYLNQDFFIIRTIAVFVILVIFYFLLAGRSFRQDNGRNR